MRKLGLVVLALTGIFAFDQAATAEEATVDELKKALSGNTIEGKNRNGTPLRVLHAANGKTVFEIKGGG